MPAPAQTPEILRDGTADLGVVDPLDSRQFLIAIRRLADALAYGTDSSPFLGSGLEYVQSRTYVPGDPIKAIDWRVTARTGKPFIKEYEAPKQMPVHLVLDTSASMAVSSLPTSKYAHACQIAGGIALAALDRVSPVGLLGAGDRDLNIRPSLSKQQILEWLHLLRHHRFDESTTLGRKLAELGPSLPNRALVIILSDMHEPEALPSLKLIAQRHDCAVIQLRDPAEEGLRGAGIYRGREAETGRVFTTTGRSGGRLKRLFGGKHEPWVDQDRLDEAMRQSGIDHLLLSTDAAIAHPLRSFLESRGVLGRGAR